MNTLLNLKDIPLVKKILGAVFFVFTFTSLFDGNILFTVIFIVLGCYFFSTDGTEINLDTKLYREVQSLFGYRFGKWKVCPDFEYVSVFKTKENQTIRVVTAEATIQSDIILLNVFYEGNKHITFYKTTDKMDAFKVAEKLKSIFNIDILDATESEKKWL